MTSSTDELRALLAKTTPGEWRYVTRKEQSESGCYYNAGRVVSSGVDVADAVNANAEFIAIAHNIMPQLLDRLEAAEEYIKELIEFSYSKMKPYELKKLRAACLKWRTLRDGG